MSDFLKAYIARAAVNDLAVGPDDVMKVALYTAAPGFHVEQTGGPYPANIDWHEAEPVTVTFNFAAEAFIEAIALTGRRIRLMTPAMRRFAAKWSRQASLTAPMTPGMVTWPTRRRRVRRKR